MRIKSFFAMLTVILLAVACNPSEKAFEPSLEVNGIEQNTVSAPAAGTNFSFTVKGNVAYTIASDKEWATMNPASVENADKETLTTTVTVTVEANTAEEAREATIKITADGYASLDYTFTVNQAAAVYEKSLQVLNSTLSPVTETINVESSDAAASVMVVSTVSWTATSSASWLSVDPASATVENYEETPVGVNFQIEDNATTETREATVTFAGEGVDPVTVTVSQAGKVVYTFELDVTNITESSATIVCTPSNDDVFYLLSCEYPRYVNQFATGEELAAADIEYFRSVYGDKYASYGFSSFEELFTNGLCDTGYKEWTVDCESATSYIAYVFAVDAELNIVSEVFKKEFSTKELEATEEYKKWLGDWTVTGANGVVNNCTIAVSAGNKSYTISGIQNFTDKIDCNYNSDGSMSIITTDLEDFTDQSYGPIDLWFLGKATIEGQPTTINGNYAICTATLVDDSHATATAASITLANQSEVTLTSMEFVGKILEGEYAGYVLTFNGDKVSFPLSFSKVEGTQSAAAGTPGHSSRKLLKNHSSRGCTPVNYVELR